MPHSQEESNDDDGEQVEHGLGENPLVLPIDYVID